MTPLPKLSNPPKRFSRLVGSHFTGFLGPRADRAKALPKGLDLAKNPFDSFGIFGKALAHSKATSPKSCFWQYRQSFGLYWQDLAQIRNQLKMRAYCNVFGVLTVLTVLTKGLRVPAGS